MSAPKVKNLILLVLLLVNVFLLILVVPAQLETRRQQQEADARLAALFTEADLSFRPKTIPAGLPLREVRMSLDAQTRAAAASALLGDASEEVPTDRGVRYTSSIGELTFYGTRFSATLSLPAENPEEFSRTLLEKMGLKVFDLQVEETGGATVCTVRLDVLDLHLADSPVTLRYENGQLVSLDGIYVATSGLTRVGHTDTVSARNALVAFLGSRLSTGWMGSEILDVRQGWFISRSTGGDSILCPIWSVSTDTGEYLVNGITQAVFIGL